MMKLRPIIILVITALSLLAVLYFIWLNQPSKQIEMRPVLWDFDMRELSKLTITLPRKNLNQSWVRNEDKQWYFDEETPVKVDPKRWGGGVALLLSNPAMNRLITEEASKEQLDLFGFPNASMELRLKLASNISINVDIGNLTPDQQSYYIKLTESKEVYTIDYTWYAAFEKLVTDPPYLLNQ